MNSSSMHIMALLLFISGTIIGIWGDKRRFYRRSDAGREMYESFSSAELNGCMNTGMNLAAKVFVIVAIVLAIYWKLQH